MRILLLEPYLTESHRAWAEGYARHSRFQVQVLSLPGRHWKWRMHGAAVTMADQTRGQPAPDAILASDMMDLATFLGLMAAEWRGIPSVLYMHENQLSYPWSPEDPDPGQQRDLHYAWLHVTGGLAADEIWFNSEFHRRQFFDELDQYLRRLPRPRPKELIPRLQRKALCQPLGLEPGTLQVNERPIHEPPVIVWNHRWEYDKGPKTFFSALQELQSQGIPFQLVVLGKAFARQPGIFAEARVQLADRILHWGFVEQRSQYLSWLRRCDLMPVTAHHDFFGLSVLEGLACGLYPLLPRRLAYPEHFPPEQFPDCYYREGQLSSALRSWLASPHPAPAGLRARIQALAWPVVAEHYDQRLEALILAKK